MGFLRGGQSYTSIHHEDITMPDTRSDQEGEFISDEDFESCLKEIELRELQSAAVIKEDVDVDSSIASDGSCSECKEYKMQYRLYRGKVATVRMEAEMMESELEGIEHIKGSISHDEASTSVIEEVYMSILHRRVRLIRDFSNYLNMTRPVTALLRGICIVHQEELPAVKFLMDVTQDLFMGIWRGDINYVPRSRR